VQHASHQCAALQVTAVQSPSSPGLRGSGLLPYNYFHCTSILRRAIHHTAPQCAPHQCTAPHLRGFSLPDATVQPLQFIAGRFISQQGIAFQTHSKAIQFTGFMVPVATVVKLPLHCPSLLFYAGPLTLMSVPRTTQFFFTLPSKRPKPMLRASQNPSTNPASVTRSSSLSKSKMSSRNKQSTLTDQGVLKRHLVFITLPR